MEPALQSIVGCDLALCPVEKMPASAYDNRGTVLEGCGALQACWSDLDTVHDPLTCLHPDTLLEKRSAGVIGDQCAPSRSSPSGPGSVRFPPSGPPMGDARQWTPFIVAPIKILAPSKALEALHRRFGCSDADWWTINLVKIEASAILRANQPHSLGKAFLVVHKVASAADRQSDVGVALRPVETSFAEAMGQQAHKQAVSDHWLNKNGGPRGEYLRSIEAEIGQELTPQLKSRVLLTYHKLYGSSERPGESLFNSKSYNYFLRKGYKRPGRKQPKETKGEFKSVSNEQEKETETTPTGMPQYVVLPVTSNLDRNRRKKLQRRQKAHPQDQASQAHQHPVDPVEPHQVQQHPVEHMVQMSLMWTPLWPTDVYFYAQGPVEY